MTRDGVLQDIMSYLSIMLNFCIDHQLNFAIHPKYNVYSSVVLKSESQYIIEHITQRMVKVMAELGQGPKISKRYVCCLCVIIPNF